MATPPTPKQRDAWFQRLQRLVAEDKEWLAPRIRRDFFGEDWILPQAFWEALHADRVGELIEPLENLQDRPWETLYDPAIAGQGKQLAQGAVQTVLAACRYALHRDNLSSAAECLHRAAAAFDAAWPAPPGKAATGPLVRDACFAACAIDPKTGQPTAQTLGFWIAWDLFDRLLGDIRDPENGQRLPSTALPGRSATACQTVQLPLLLVDPKQDQGRPALLTVTLVPDGGGVFCPDPLAMGLSALWQDPSDERRNVYDSMQRIWKLSGLGNGYRGRWSFSALTQETIQGLAKPGNRDPLITPYFSGRSAEAAVWCALQSAASSHTQPLLLDRYATVTAMLDAAAPAAEPRQTRLTRIEGIIPKVLAAGEFLQVVVVAKDQEEVVLDQAVEIIRAATVGEAFDRLLSLNRHVRNYQTQVVAKWQEEWATE